MLNFCIVILLVSCGKKHEVSGTVTNYFDGTTVEGLRIDLVKWKNSTIGAVKVRSGIVASTSSDKNGSFSIDYSYTKGNYFSIELHNPIGLIATDPMYNLNSEGSSFQAADSISEKDESYILESIYKEGNISTLWINEVEKKSMLTLKVVPVARIKINSINNSSESVRIVYSTNRYSTIYGSQSRNHTPIFFIQGYRYVVPLDGIITLEWSPNKINPLTNNWLDSGTSTVAIAPFSKLVYMIQP